MENSKLTFIIGIKPRTIVVERILLDGKTDATKPGKKVAEIMMNENDTLEGVKHFFGINSQEIREIFDFVKMINRQIKGSKLLHETTDLELSEETIKVLKKHKIADVAHLQDEVVNRSFKGVSCKVHREILTLLILGM